MNKPLLLPSLLALSAEMAAAQTAIDSITVSGSTLTGIFSGTESYTSLVTPTLFRDNKIGTDYVHIDSAAPASLTESIGSLNLSKGSLNNPFEVQFGQTLFPETAIYLIVNESDATVADVATIYPIDASGNRIGTAGATLRFPDFGSMPVLSTSNYNRTTDGAPNGTLNRVLAGVVFTLSDLGIGGLAGTEGLEIETTTLDPQEIGLASAGSVNDPVLLQDATFDTSLAFGKSFQVAGSPAETAVRTVRYVNAGPTQNLTVNSVTASPDFTVTEVKKNGIIQSPPFSLNIGDGIEISIKGTPAQTGPDAFFGTVTVDTNSDSQDKVLSASATVVGAGDILVPNPTFTLGGAGATGWSQSHARVNAGLTTGSMNAIRIYGEGDVSGNTIGQANQTTAVPDGLTDFESVFVFTPVSNFEDYLGSVANGDLTDRGMQYLLLADDTAAASGNPMTDSSNILVNLAYLTDGSVSGGTPGFYVFDGSNWQLAIATNLAGSDDADRDGVLDATSGDTVNAYRVSIAGSGFGMPGATYTVSVSEVGAQGFTGTLSSGPLNAWHGISGELAPVAAHSFTTADRSDSNSGSGRSTPFWVDFAALYFANQPEAVLSVVGQPDLLLANGNVFSISSAPVIIRNDGDSANLIVSSVTFSDPSFSAADLPLTLAPGASTALTVQWNSSQAAPNTAARTELEINSNDPSPNTIINLRAGVTSNAAFNPNWNFEVAGEDPSGDSDTFIFWQEGTNVQDVPGLLAGSNTSAHVNGNSGLNTSFIAVSPIWNGGANWMAEGIFAIGGLNDRVFNFKVREELEDTFNDGIHHYTEINIRYEANRWQVFNGIPGNGGVWVDLIDLTGAPLEISQDNDGNGSLNDPGDIKIPYRIQIVGSGWNNESTPTFDLEIFDQNGTSLGSAKGRTEILNGNLMEDLPRVGPNLIEVRNTGSEFWIDDVVLSSATSGPGVVILGVTGGPGRFTITYDAGGADVTIERSSPGMQNFEIIATGENSGVFADIEAPNGKAFYRVVLSE